MVVKRKNLKLSLWWSNNNDHPLFGIHSFCRGNLKESRTLHDRKHSKKLPLTSVTPISEENTGNGQKIWTLSINDVPHLDWGSSKVRQLFDVLTLLANDGSHCECWDEKVYRLRFWVSLVGTSTSAPLGPAENTRTLTTEHSLKSIHQRTNADGRSSKSCSVKARLELERTGCFTMRLPCPALMRGSLELNMLISHYLDLECVIDSGRIFAS